MKIAVTGGAGFIGSHIVDAYIAQGHSVVVVDSLITGSKLNLNPKVRFYQIDICNRRDIINFFEKEKPEVLNHHAAQMDVRKSVSDPAYDASVNICGFINLMEAGRLYNLEKVIFASSGGAIYGDATVLPTPETYNPRPASPYGISKLATEYYLNYYFQVYNISFVALRYGNVYGPRQNPFGEAGVVAIFARRMLHNEEVIINGDGSQSRDFVFVRDVVDANVKALTYNKSLVANIGTGKSTNINTIFDILLYETKTKISKKYGSAKPGEQKISLLDIKLAEKYLSWKPKVSLEQGLKETAVFFQNEKK